MTHTPGPWGALDDGAIITMTGARVVVASIRGGFGHGVQEANARLIAAAPETAAAPKLGKLIRADATASINTKADSASHMAKTKLSSWVAILRLCAVTTLLVS